jgi:hypothetical protein
LPGGRSFLVGSNPRSGRRLVLGSWSKRIRRNHGLYILLGAILIYWGIVFTPDWCCVAPFMTMGRALMFIGVITIIYCLGTLVRHKLDYDDFDEFEDERDDDSRKGSGDR